MKHGLWFSVGGEPLAESVEISIEKNDQFTTAVVARNIRPRTAELAVISIAGDRADYLAIGQKGRGVATGQITIVFSNLIPLDGLDVETIRSCLPFKFRSRFDPPEVGCWRPSPRLWEEIQRAIGDERPDVAGRTRDLRAIITGSRNFTGRIEGGLEVFERDAVASALQTWGGDSFRKRVLRNAVPSRSTPVAPFLSQLKEVALREDPQVGNDHITFPGMDIARKDMVGSIVLSDRHGDEFLTILNCNRQPLERTLGVDLIYYSHRFDSFVLVQYKRMKTEKNGIPCYRPKNDPYHDKEVKRMRVAERAMRSLPRTKDLSTDNFRP